MLIRTSRMRRALENGLACLSLLVASSLGHSEENWTRFRGQNGSGVVSSSTVPLPWSSNDVRWKIELPGEGHSSPVIFGNQAFVFTAKSADASRQLSAVDLSNGKILWKQNFASEPHDLHKFSSYAAASPCVDDKAVYIAWATPKHVYVKSFAHNGQLLWERDLGTYVSQHGFGTSPIRIGDLLVVLNSQDAEELPPGVEPGDSALIALNAKSGEITWEAERLSTRVCYGVPAVVQDKSGKQIILGAGATEGFYAIDASNGEQLWNVKEFGKRVVSSAVVADDLLISTCGSGGGGNELVAIELNGDHKERFRVKRAAPYVPTPIAKDGLLYLWADNGIVSCVSLKDGSLKWTERVGGNVSSSPIIVGDKLIGIADDGVVTILKTSEKFENLGQVQLGETVRSTPAASNDLLLIHTEKQLIAIGKK